MFTVASVTSFRLFFLIASSTYSVLYIIVNVTSEIDECLSTPCVNGAHCQDIVAGYQCYCLQGFAGRNCQIDVNECASTDPCDNKATCTNTFGGFQCQCNVGYEGDGFTCSDENECAAGTHRCDENAKCTNSHGSHVCTCNVGYHGDGFTCNICGDQLYGEMCSSDCTCVSSMSSCHHITGNCTCTPQFEEAVCDKRELQVRAEVQDIIVEEERVELVCRVNLPNEDITVVWTTPRGQQLDSKFETGGSYVAILKDVSANDNGNYTCTARTDLGPDKMDTVKVEVHDKPKVEIIALEAINSTALKVKWSLPYDREVLIDRCQLKYRQGLTTSWVEVSPNIDPNVLHYTISGLEPYTEYSIEFRCFTQFGEIPYIEMGPTRTAEAAPSKPLNVVSTDLPSNCLISWNIPETSNGIITQYTIYYSIIARLNINDTETDYVVVDDVLSTRYNFSKAAMSPFSRYEFTLSASTSAGESEPCECHDVSCDTLPAAPSDIMKPEAVGDVNNEDNTFMIQLVPSSNRNGPVACYEVIIFPYTQDNFVVGSGQDPDELFPPNLIGSYANNNGAAGSLYVAFVISGSSLSEAMNVTIGDGVKSQCSDRTDKVQRRRRIPPGERLGENGALKPGLTYTAFVRAYVMVDENQVKYSSSSFMDPVKLPDTTPPATSPPDNEPSTSFENSLVLFVAAGAAAAVLFLVCLIAVCISCRRRQKRKVPFKSRGRESINSPDYEMNIRRTGSIAPLIHSIEMNEKRRSEEQLKQLKRGSDTSVRYQEEPGAVNEGFNPTEDYTYIDDEATDYRILWEQLMLGQNILGTGTFGDVVEGVVFKKDRNIVKVAVKKWKTSEPDKDPASTTRKDFIAEVEMMKNIGYHPNVIALVGTCNHEGYMYVATELARKGDLRTFLRNSRRTHAGQSTSTIPSQQLLRFGVDIAAGMEYVASKGIIHRDLAARNILLSEALTAKISDFGLSRGEETYVKTSKARIPVRWMALESLEKREYSTKSDVWSFGILLWEIATLGGTPYPNEDPKYMIPLLRSGYRMSKPQNCLQEMYIIMTECWAKDPADRPPFDELTPQLFRMLEDETTYLSTAPKTGFTFEPIESKYAEY